MPKFNYKARAVNGNIVTSVIEAAEQRIAVENLKKQKLIVTEIKQIEENAIATFIQKNNPFREKVTTKDMVLFSRQLSTMVSAGVPLVQGLTILGEQLENATFRKVICTVRDDIESGISISEAMRRHPETFTNLYVSMINAGEIGGVLDAILDRLSAYLEAAEALSGRIKGAMTYPAVIVVIAFVIVIFLMVGVMPTFKGIFDSFGAELPFMTSFLLATSDFMQKNVLVIIGVPAAIVIGLQNWYKTPQGTLVIDDILLKMPVIGDVQRKTAIAKFCRTMGTLLKSGVPIMQAMETVANTAGNKIIENAVLKIRDSVREGTKIADPLKASGIFPPMVIQMISVGEETGNLDTMLNKIADFYDQEVDVAVSAMMGMLEPMIMVFLGITLGAIVVAMLMPMLSMSSIVSSAE
ncbi:MAG: type II secretion system F family protein [Elusimicrobiota bacterium]